MSGVIAVRNPRTGAIDFELEPASARAVAEQAESLRAVQAGWAARPLEDRCAALSAWADAIEADATVIADALERDTGRRRIAGMEVAGVVAAIRGWTKTAPALIASPDWTPGRSNPALRHTAQDVPYGLVGVISPWNFPLTLSLIDAVPALIAGCAVLIKPSEVTPRFAGPLMAATARSEGVREVLGLAQGGALTGAALTGAVDLVCFTGSVATGRKVAAQAAERLIPAYLELGGKDPLIVLDGADIEAATDATLRGSVLSTGQACQSIERIYVQRPMHDAFLERLTEKALGVRLNHPDIGSGELGPIIFERQADILAAQIADARAKGAHVLTGGEIETLGGGLWLRPTVIAGVTHAMAVMTEETFGPLLPVMAFDHADEAVALANDTEYGLSAAVFARTLEEAEAVARRLEAGAVSMNDAALTALFHEAEKQSFKASGLGPSRMGSAGLLRFFRRKALIANTGRPSPLSVFAEEA